MKPLLILTDLGFIADGNYDSLLETYSQKCKEKLTVFAHDNVTGPCCYYNYKGCMLLWLSRYLVVIGIACVGIFPDNWQE
jgi:hypothetical protein